MKIQYPLTVPQIKCVKEISPYEPYGEAMLCIHRTLSSLEHYKIQECKIMV